MPSQRSRAEFTAQARAELFYKLAALERAGIPLLQTLPLLGRASAPALQRKIEPLIEHIQRGRSLAEAARRCGLLLPWEARLVRVGEEAGRLAAVFAHLAEHYATRARWLRRLKSRFALPIAVLALALFVAPVPDLFQGNIDAGGYWLRTVVPLAAGYLGIRWAAHLYRRLSVREQGQVMAGLLLDLPILGTLIRRQQQRDFLANLAILLEAGIPAVEALTLAAQSLPNPMLRTRLSGAASAVAEGASVSAALARSGALEDPQATALIDTGELSGRLDEMLRYQVRRLEERLDSQMDSLAEWLPRIFYALVAGWIIGSIL